MLPSAAPMGGAHPVAYTALTRPRPVALRDCGPGARGEALHVIVVLFGTELRPDIDRAEYVARNARMDELVRQLPGFISVKSYTAEDGDRVVIARFESAEALNAWRYQPEHIEAQSKGRESYYDSYWVQVCESVREYAFQRGA